MSCDIVPKEHIDVMCWALATFNNRSEYARTEMTLFHEDGVREYVKFLDIPRPHLAGMNRLGQILMEENYRSVNARYRENTPCPEYRWAPPVSDEWSCEAVYLFEGKPEHSVKEPVDVERLRELARRHDLLKPNVVAWLDDLDENAERETALPAEEAPVHGRDKDGEEL